MTRPKANGHNAIKRYVHGCARPAGAPHTSAGHPGPRSRHARCTRSAFDELADKWGQRYPAVVRLWDNAWAEFIAFLDYDVEIRRVICSTNSIESVNGNPKIRSGIRYRVI